MRSVVSTLSLGSLVPMIAAHSCQSSNDYASVASSSSDGSYGSHLLAVRGLAGERRNIFAYLLTFLVICWCAATSASIFEAALRMEHQKWLVAYPLFLCYSAFALITIF